MGGYTNLQLDAQTDPTQPQSAPQSYGNSTIPLAPSDGSAGSLTSGNVQFQPDPIQQLESQVGPARQDLGQALQQQQGQLSQAQTDLTSPIQREIQRQSQQLQDLQPSSNRGGPI